MTVAVFIYVAPKTFRPEDGQWLQALLQAMAVAKKNSRFLIFSNMPEEAKPAGAAFIYPQWEAPRLMMVRQWTLRLWGRKAREAGATAVICVGLSSVVSVGLPTFVLLPPGTKMPEKGAQKTSAAAYWVTTGHDGATASRLGLGPVVHLSGGPLLPSITGAERAEITKNRFTEGGEYFLYAGPLAATPVFIGLLKAFSRFKHRQKSSWKLVLLPAGPAPTDLQQALKTYKYRADVVLTDAHLSGEEKGALLAAAYAFVQPTAAGPYGSFLKEAVCAELPVVAAGSAENKEWAGNAALYYEAGDEQGLAECLMRVYKDEALRGRLAAAAAQIAATATWAQSAAAAWQSLDTGEK